MKTQKAYWKNATIIATILMGFSLENFSQSPSILLPSHTNNLNATQIMTLSASSISIINKKSVEIQLSDLKKKFDSGRYSIDELYKYITLLKQENQPYSPIVNGHIQRMQQKSLQNNNMKFIWDFSADLNTKAMDYLLEHKLIFENTYGQQAVENQITSSVWAHVSLAVAQKNISLLQRAMQIIEKSEMPTACDIYYNIQKKYYEATNDYKSALQIKRLENTNEKHYQNAIYWQEKAWYILMQQPDTKNIKTALQYIEHSIKLDSQYENNQTHAFLLFKLGKKQLAQKAAKKALQLAQKNNQDATGAINLLHALNN